MKRTWLIAGLLILTFSLPALSMAALATPTTSAPTGSAAGAAAGTSTAAPNSISDPLSTLTSVKVKDADVREVLATVFRAVGVDFLLTDEVSGKISMIRQNAPARTILEIICAGQGLHWWKKGDTYVVSARPDSAPAESASAAVPQPLPAGAKKWRSYAVQHQHPRDLASCFNPQQEPTTEGRMWRMSLTGVFADSLARGQDPGQHNREFVDTSLKPFDSGASRLGESAQFPGYSGSAFGPGFGPGYGAPQAQGVTPNAGTTGLPLTPEEEEMLRSGINIGAPFAALLPPGMTAPVAYEPLNYLIFEATDEAYDRFLELVRIFDQKPKQVILEVQFITMSTSDAFSLGLDWFWNVGQTALNVAGMAPGGNVTLRVAKGQQFGAVLSTLLTTGRARLVNAPRIRGMNNFPATISFMDQIPYVDFSGAVAVPNGGIIGGGATIRTVSVPTQLSIVPRINGDDSITALLAPIVSTTRNVSVPTPTGGSQTVPLISSQSLSTLLNIRDGETTVIGGFINRNETVNRTKIPLLADIPILGPLFFTRTEKNTADSELLIFVTPHVIHDEATGVSSGPY